ncbi:hypothetical protein PUP66_14020 [Pseudomonas chlororaphis]|uniref:hypothetical protein n=1 Tax=Pseudomonas chlororaphis TaxID=587753 RepID=UPI000789CEF1|nr:hypothetical protein [Pseudomonas chlororaphis]AMS17675.1 hypothetical protein A3218_26520 [Pseudomonas chlororaphis]AZD15541.1 hypothetical protein C4K25_2612 [Pseudomonas chlororaphis]WDH49949.1 hypothetical protein PUP66_14020 [Pseudomonas chlororaphis]WDH61798.1 hypothetical protein PUP56_14025 [Pseudomonas chlororaphis]WQE21055.1 hypothetical protein U0007_12835 [Pseudomonas chlororaphis]
MDPKRYEHLTISVEPHEMRMSHWVYAPRVVDARDGRVVLDLSGGPWDLVSCSPSTAAVELLLRKYPGEREAVCLSIRLADNSLWLEGTAVATENIEGALERAHG